MFSIAHQLIFCFIDPIRFIKANEEITTSYTNLLWGTVTRRHNLFTTKHFWCHCERCLNISEFDCPLSALYCLNLECRGYLLPKTYLDIKSEWECNKCKMCIPVKKIGMIHSTLGGVIHNYYSQSIPDVIEFLQTRLSCVVPPCSQLAIEFKLRLISLLGTANGFSWKGK